MAYGKLHRFFLRTVASQGVLSMIDAQSVLERFNDEEQISVTDIVKAINDEIRPYYQEIKVTKDEVTNEDVIVFLSLADDVATKAQNVFTSTELEYFRLLIEHIMSTESRQITSINAVNLVGSMKSSFTKTDAQKVLNTWCRMRYFDKEQDNYALGLRTIHEFEGYFRQNMQHAVEECFLCKHIVFRGYNCPGCGQAIHTRCLMKYLEKVQKWPCCKIDFEQEQLERLNNEGSRLQQTQLSDTTRQSEENNTVVMSEPTQVPEASEAMDETQDVIPEISQRLTRKRKRQISPQTQIPTTSSTNNNAVINPTEALRTRLSTDETIEEEPAQVQSPRESIRNSSDSEPFQVITKRRSKKNTIVEEPEETSTSRRSSKDTIAEKPTKAPSTRRSIRKSTEEPSNILSKRRSSNGTIVEESVQVSNTRRSTRTSAVKETAQVLTRRRSTKDSTEEAPKQAQTTRRPKKDTIVEEDAQVPNTRRSKKDTIMEEDAQVPNTRRSKKDTIMEEDVQVLNTGRSIKDTIVEKPTRATRRTRNTIPEPEPLTQVQESFESLNVTGEVNPEVSQRVNRKRKQQ